MTQATELPFRRRAPARRRLVAGVCLAHLVSHYYIVLLAPLFVFIRADYGVSYTELGLALTAFNVVSARAADAGRLLHRPHRRAHQSDRRPAARFGRGRGRRRSSIRSGCSLRCSRVLGLANTVYHPADYALLSERVAPRRMTQVFSFHTFAGMIGSAIAPVTLLFMQSLVGWRGAFLGASALGVIAALFLVLQGEPPAEPPRASRRKPRDGRQPASRPPTAGSFCCRRRSCSTSCSSSCCRWWAAGSTSTWSSGSARCTARRRRSPTPR